MLILLGVVALFKAHSWISVDLIILVIIPAVTVLEDGIMIHYSSHLYHVFSLGLRIAKLYFSESCSINWQLSWEKCKKVFTQSAVSFLSSPNSIKWPKTKNASHCVCIKPRALPRRNIPTICQVPRWPSAFLCYAPVYGWNPIEWRSRGLHVPAMYPSPNLSQHFNDVR